jgi:signal transduction histidine kinase/DNA-binding response OmpR family regulator
MSIALSFRMLVMLMGCACVAIAQDRQPYMVTVQHYSLEQGLPNRIIHDIGQDRQGFIWVGTLDNAYRFDGHKFAALALPEQNYRNQLPMSMIGIRNDTEGNLWFFGSQFAGRTQFALLPDSRIGGAASPAFFQTRFRHQYPFMTSGPCWPSHVAGPTGTPVIYTRTGEVWRYQGQGRFRRLFQHPFTDERGYLFSQANGNSLLSYKTAVTSGIQAPNYSLVELDTVGKVLRQHALPAMLHPIRVDAARETYLYRANGGIPQLTSKGIENLLYRLSPNGKLTGIPITFSTNPIPNPTQPDWYEMLVQYDEFHDLFWVLGHNVLFAWHPQKGIVFNLAETGFPVSSLQKFGALFVDRTGVVWAGSQNGLLQLTLEPNRFRNYLSQTNKHTTATTLSTRGIIQFGNELWVNANKTYRVDLTTGLSRPLSPTTGVQPLYYVAIRGHDGNFWAAFRSLVRVNPGTLATDVFPLQHLNNACWAMWQDGRQNFWLGYDQGISIFDWKSKKNTPFIKYNNYPELAENRINGFFPDKRAGGVWVAASSGLYLLDTLRGIVARYSSVEAAPRRLPFNHVTFVHPDPQQPDLYWLATRGGGLIRWERNTGHYRQFTQRDGLLNNALYCIYEDKQGRLWLPSDYGLVWFQKEAIEQKTGAIQVFLPKDGIAHEEFNLSSHFQAPDGRLFLGGLNGVTAFYPDSVQPKIPAAAPLVVTRYQKLDPETADWIEQTADFGKTRQVELQPADRSFVLSFALLDYRFNRHMRLWYRMAGWQDQWTMQTEPDLRINGLPPGHYQLEVRAQNANGQWVSEPIKVPILVLQPFYSAWWFWAVLVLSILGLIVLTFRWRNRRLEKANARLEAEVALRTAQLKADNAIIEQQAASLQESALLKARFFANVSHEFRTPLTLLLGPLEYLSRHTHDKAVRQLLHTMSRNANQLLAMVTDLLNLSKGDANQLSLLETATDLKHLLEQTVAAFEPQASLAGIRLKFEGTLRSPNFLMDGPKVETVLKNLLANAFRFTPAGKTVKIVFTELADTLEVEVSDTGTGIHPDDLPFIFDRYYQSKLANARLQGGTGIGLALCRDYCNRWGGTLTVESHWGEGSRFVFTYPKHPLAQSLTTELKPNLSLIDESKPLAGLPELNRAAGWASLPGSVHSAATQTLLLVEDHPDMLTYLQTLLSPYYTLQLANHGQQAWDWLNGLSTSDLPSLIITDVMMPEMDGLTFLRSLRLHPEARNIPVIMLSARADLSVRLLALRLGIADYLIKPFHEEELLTRISNLLERTSERDAWRQQRSLGTIPAIEPDVPNPESWLLAVQEFMLENLTNPQLQISDIAQAVNTSERHLYRRIKELTGFSPNQFMQELRLHTAREWLENRQYLTVKEVAFGVGFQKTSYFSRLYMNRFGISPGEVLRRIAPNVLKGST